MDGRGRHAVGHQLIEHRVGARLGQRDCRVRGAIAVGVTGDIHRQARELLGRSGRAKDDRLRGDVQRGGAFSEEHRKDMLGGRRLCAGCKRQQTNKDERGTHETDS
jgi:hypothetical protein